MQPGVRVTNVRRAPALSRIDQLKGVQTFASGLEFPEGPICLGDGGLLVAELKAGAITSVSPSGRVERLVRCGGGPNSLALGPDGNVYICNNGVEAGESTGGRIERFDLSSGSVEVVYDGYEGRPFEWPNDLVFDQHGGFYFTDHGKTSGGSIFYAQADGSGLVRLDDSRFHPSGVSSPNGIGLSRDGQDLYFVETFTARLFSMKLRAPGVLDDSQTMDESFVYGSSSYEWFDGLAVDSAGAVCVATLRSGGITVCDPSGSSAHMFTVEIGEKDWRTTNLCFGGGNEDRVFITLSGSGRIVTAPWPSSGDIVVTPTA